VYEQLALWLYDYYLIDLDSSHLIV